MSDHPVESLSAFLDDELSDAERRGVESHLAACPSCARHLRELAAVDALARGLPPAGAPEGYLDALPGRVRQRIRDDRPRAARVPWVWPLAAGIALAVLAPIVLQQGRFRRPAVEESRMPQAIVPPADAVQTIPAAPAGHAEPAPGPTVLGDLAVDSREYARGGARANATRRDAAPASAPAPAAKLREAFAPPPPAAVASESDRFPQREIASATAGAEQGALAGAGRDAEERKEDAAPVAESADAPAALKKTEAARPNAAPAELRRMKSAEAAADEKAFADAAALPASTLDEARTAREAWRRFVSLHPAGPRADEGRVRSIEAAVAVFRLTGDDGDRAIAERDGRAYLAVPGAPQASRVRDALRLLER